MKERKFIMKDYIFIDSNIWIYSLIPESKEKYQSIRKFLEKSFQDYRIIISFQVINEVTYVLKRKNFSEEKIKNIIRAMEENCIIVDFSMDILLKASEIGMKHKFFFWDSLIVATSILSRCKILYSENMQHKREIEKVMIINPFANFNDEKF